MNLLLRIATLLLLLSGGLAKAQITSRSGFPAPKESRLEKRPFPCNSRQIVFEEQFSGNSLPTGWTAQSRDTAMLNPAIDTVFQDNWQSIVDFKDNNNRAVASVSWHRFQDRYTPVDNWLISPEITLGANTCFSWVAYSQDRFHPESYEVLISPAGSPDLDNFTDTVEVIENESFLLQYRSTNLSAYNGQTIRVAFRHTSEQKFVLVLDDIRFAEVEDVDLGVVELIDPAPYDGASFDSMSITVAIQNFGSDTIDLADVSLGFRDQNQLISEETVVILDTNVTRLAPNDTAWVQHPTAWNPDMDSAAYDLLVWTRLDGDAVSQNDSLYRRVGVGVDITSVSPSAFEGVVAYPNPASNFLHIEGTFSQEVTATLFTMSGRRVLPTQAIQRGSHRSRMDLSTLPSGMYFLSIRDRQGTLWSQKVIVE
jgi:hypothetical protein